MAAKVPTERFRRGDTVVRSGRPAVVTAVWNVASPTAKSTRYNLTYTDEKGGTASGVLGWTLKVPA